MGPTPFLLMYLYYPMERLSEKDIWAVFKEKRPFSKGLSINPYVHPHGGIIPRAGSALHFPGRVKWRTAERLAYKRAPFHALQTTLKAPAMPGPF